MIIRQCQSNFKTNYILTFKALNSSFQWLTKVNLGDVGKRIFWWFNIEGGRLGEWIFKRWQVDTQSELFVINFEYKKNGFTIEKKLATLKPHLSLEIDFLSNNSYFSCYWVAKKAFFPSLFPMWNREPNRTEPNQTKPTLVANVIKTETGGGWGS